MKLKKTDMMKQCKFVRKADDGIRSQVAWIPEHVSVVGKKITLKAEDHKFVWTVEEASSISLPYEQVKKVSDHHRTHRKGSDI